MKQIAEYAANDDFIKISRSEVTDYCYKLLMKKPNNIFLVKTLLNYLCVLTESS